MAKTIQDLPLVLKVKDIMDLLAVSHNTAYDLVRSGQIKSIKVGKTYRIPRAAVEEYLRCATGNHDTACERLPVTNIDNCK